MGVIGALAKALSVLCAAALAVSPSDPAPKAYPANWGRSFEVRGQSRTWQVQSFFSPADFDPGAARPDLGFEFSTGDLTYRGEPTRLRWYRMEALLPLELSVRVRPGPPGTPAACAVDTRGAMPREGSPIAPGAHFHHGVCDAYPWQRPATELADSVTKGLYVVAWEDDAGVHAEVLPLSEVKWQ